MVYNVPVKPPLPVFRPGAPGAKYCRVCLPIADYEKGRKSLINLAPNPKILECPIVQTPSDEVAEWRYRREFGPALHTEIADNAGVLVGAVDDVCQSLTEQTFVFLYGTDDGTSRDSMIFGTDATDGWTKVSVRWQTPLYIYWGNWGTAAQAPALTMNQYRKGPNLYVITIGPRNYEVWVNGKVVYSAVGNNSRQAATGTTNFYLFGGAGLYSSDAATMHYFASYNRQLTIQEINDISSDPWCMIRPPKMFWMMGGVISAGAALLGIINESENVDETLFNPLAMNRVLDEEQDIDETSLRSLDMSRVVDEEENIDETTVRPMTLTRLVDESENVDETTVSIRGLVRLVDESENIDETASSIRGLVRLVDESENIDETTGSAKGFIRVVDEEQDIDETVSSVRGFVRIVDEEQNINESILRFMGVVKVVDEEQDIDETLPRLMSMNRVLDEEQDIDETVNRRGALVRFSNEDMEIAESVLRPRVLARIIDEVENLTEDIVDDITHILIKVIDESQNIDEVTVHVIAAAGTAIYEEYTIILKDNVNGITLKNVIKDINLSDGSGDIVT